MEQPNGGLRWSGDSKARCVRPGEALYGRWGDTTLRLVPRRVEQSADNSRFSTLAEQDRSCTFPGLR